MTVEKLIKELEYYRDRAMGDAIVYLDTGGLDNINIGYLPQIEINGVWVIDEGEVGIGLLAEDVEWIKKNDVTKI